MTIIYYYIGIFTYILAYTYYTITVLVDDVHVYGMLNILRYTYVYVHYIDRFSHMKTLGATTI